MEDAISSVGFFIVAGTLALVNGQIQDGTLLRNGDVGIRTKLTKSSDEAWEAGHKAALPLLRRCAWLYLAWGLGVVALAFLPVPSLVVNLFSVLGYVLVIVSMVLAAHRANAAVNALGDNSEHVDGSVSET